MQKVKWTAMKSNNEQVSVSAQKKESGELSILLQIGLPTQVLQKMDICAFHLAHPNLSQFQVALQLGTNKPMVQRAYRLFEPLVMSGSNL